MRSYYLVGSTETLAAVRTAARRLGADVTTSGARAVITVDDDRRVEDVWLRAGVLPRSYYHDRDPHDLACAAWL